ncbi:5'-methylthioadenosine/S-adenosylhomocysteine nucleosidase [Nocardia sp. NPDC051756]|uniref:5'-methylthioadenosine/S-adenosylhomocysteine nucleosidase family protein n=1 Tax=Nocardia sp. NPDC051756 TaxID=3154751 RepID=UPI003431DCA6
MFLTALDLEGEAVRAHLAGLQTRHHPAGTVFEVGHLAGRPDYPVALAVIGMGTVNAAAITERAIAEFRPSAVVFVGIAGGLREWIALGDVVVATRVYAYHGGRVDQDTFLARPRAWDTSHRLVQLAKYVNRNKAWPGATHTEVAVHFEPVAAGEIVLNASAGPEHDRLHSHYNDAVAIEMESAGVALAGQLHDSTPTIAVRGISDRADGAKHDADNAGWQPVAAANAASFAVGLAAAIHETQEKAVTTNEPPQGPGQGQQPPSQVHSNEFTHTEGGISTGGDMRLGRGSKAVARDDNSDNSRRGYRGFSLGGIRISRGGLAAAAAGMVVVGGAGVFAITRDAGLPAPETVGTDQGAAGITEVVNAFTAAVVADDAERACEFVGGFARETDESYGTCEDKVRNGRLLGQHSIPVVKALDGKAFVVRAEGTEGRAEYNGSLYFELGYGFGRWYVTDLMGYASYVN